MSNSKPNKTKPLWGSQFADHRVPLGMMLGDEELMAIATHLEAPDLASQSHFLQDLIITAEDYWRLKANLPRPSKLQIKAALDHIASSAMELHHNMDQLDDWSRLFLNDKWTSLIAERDNRVKRIMSTSPIELDPSEWHIEREINDNLLSVLSELFKAAEAASDSITNASQPKPNRGRKRNDALYLLIDDLHDLYVKHVNPDIKLTYDSIDETYKGPFLDLVRTYLVIIDPEVNITDTALGDSIRRALGKRS